MLLQPAIFVKVMPLEMFAVTLTKYCYSKMTLTMAWLMFALVDVSFFCYRPKSLMCVTILDPTLLFTDVTDAKVKIYSKCFLDQILASTKSYQKMNVSLTEKENSRVSLNERLYALTVVKIINEPISPKIWLAEETNTSGNVKPLSPWLPIVPRSLDFNSQKMESASVTGQSLRPPKSCHIPVLDPRCLLRKWGITAPQSSLEVKQNRHDNSKEEAKK